MRAPHPPAYRRPVVATFWKNRVFQVGMGALLVVLAVSLLPPLLRRAVEGRVRHDLAAAGLEPTGLKGLAIGWRSTAISTGIGLTPRSGAPVQGQDGWALSVERARVDVGLLDLLSGGVSGAAGRAPTLTVSRVDVVVPLDCIAQRDADGRPWWDAALTRFALPGLAALRFDDADITVHARQGGWRLTLRARGEIRRQARGVDGAVALSIPGGALGGDGQGGDEGIPLGTLSLRAAPGRLRADLAGGAVAMAMNLEPTPAADVMPDQAVPGHLIANGAEEISIDVPDGGLLRLPPGSPWALAGAHARWRLVPSSPAHGVAGETVEVRLTGAATGPGPVWHAAVDVGRLPGQGWSGTALLSPGPPGDEVRVAVAPQAAASLGLRLFARLSGASLARLGQPGLTALMLGGDLEVERQGRAWRWRLLADRPLTLEGGGEGGGTDANAGAAPHWWASLSSSSDPGRSPLLEGTVDDGAWSVRGGGTVWAQATTPAAAGGRVLRVHADALAFDLPDGAARTPLRVELRGAAVSLPGIIDGTPPFAVRLALSRDETSNWHAQGMIEGDASPAPWPLAATVEGVWPGPLGRGALDVSVQGDTPGRVTGRVHLDGWQGSAQVGLTDAHLSGPGWRMDGGWLRASFSQIFPLTTSAPATLGAQRLWLGGVEWRDMSVELAAQGGGVRVAAGQADWAGGRAVVLPGGTIPGVVTLGLRDVSLAQALPGLTDAAYQSDDTRLAGALALRIPVDGDWVLEGDLSAPPGAVLRHPPGSPFPFDPARNRDTALLSAALTHARFDPLRLRLDGPLRQPRWRLIGHGVNPDFYGGYPLDVDIDVTTLAPRG